MLNIRPCFRALSNCQCLLAGEIKRCDFKANPWQCGGYWPFETPAERAATKARINTAAEVYKPISTNQIAKSDSVEAESLVNKGKKIIRRK